MHILQGLSTKIPKRIDLVFVEFQYPLFQSTILIDIAPITTLCLILNKCLVNMQNKMCENYNETKKFIKINTGEKDELTFRASAWIICYIKRFFTLIWIFENVKNDAHMFLFDHVKPDVYVGVTPSAA